MLKRFFHLRIAADNWTSTTGGCTIAVTQKNPGDKTVIVQATRCSPLDVYVRKVGRDTALAKEPEEIKLVDLPKYLAEKHRRACKESGVVRWASRPSDFAFSVLYFMREPKE